MPTQSNSSIFLDVIDDSGNVVDFEALVDKWKEEIENE